MLSDDSGCDPLGGSESKRGWGGHWCFTHRTSINKKEDKACGRFCMEYSAINVIECRIHADSPAIYIVDVWIGGSGMTLNVMFVVIASLSNKNRTSNKTEQLILQ